MQTTKLSAADLTAMLKVPSAALGQGDVAELILQEIIGNKHIRYRSGPDESQRAAMKVIVVHWVTNYQPIPFLCPCGSEKPQLGQLPDVAELCMIESIRNLQHRVQRWYPPGITVNMRIEDASAPYLFKGHEEEAWTNANAYSSALVDLIVAARVSGYIHEKRESHKIEWPMFEKVAQRDEAVLLNYIRQPFDSGAQRSARHIGWTGNLSVEMIEYYRGCHKRLYPDLIGGDVDESIARYFASALARYKLHITGAEMEWGKNFLGLNYCPPVSGAPRMRNIMHYRTIPATVSSMHGAPWRMKGYVQSRDNIPRLASWHDRRTYHSGVIDVNGFELTADYGD